MWGTHHFKWDNFKLNQNEMDWWVTENLDAAAQSPDTENYVDPRKKKTIVPEPVL